MADHLHCHKFVSRCATERQRLLDSYFVTPPTTAVGLALAELLRSGADTALLRGVLDQGLRDALMTLLYGLSGAASLGDEQQRYAVLDEHGRTVSEDAGGDLESYAFDFFAADTEKGKS